MLYIVIVIVIVHEVATVYYLYTVNVAFKVAKMRDSIMEDQDELIMRKSECEELGSEANAKAVLDDVGHNADVYIANQEDNTQN